MPKIWYFIHSTKWFEFIWESEQRWAQSIECRKRLCSHRFDRKILCYLNFVDMNISMCLCIRQLKCVSVRFQSLWADGKREKYDEILFDAAFTYSGHFGSFECTQIRFYWSEIVSFLFLFDCLFIDRNENWREEKTIQTMEFYYANRNCERTKIGCRRRWKTQWNNRCLWYLSLFTNLCQKIIIIFVCRFKQLANFNFIIFFLLTITRDVKTTDKCNHIFCYCSVFELFSSLMWLKTHEK